MAETSNTSLESNASDRSETSPFEAFGPNSGLVEEMYRQYLQNPNSVGDGWAEFFADYTPRSQRDSSADLTIDTPQTTPSPTSTSCTSRPTDLCQNKSITTPSAARS